MQQLGKNIQYALSDEDGKKVLTLKINLDERLGKSKSGQSTIVATTSGNQAIGETGVIIGINAYVK